MIDILSPLGLDALAEAARRGLVVAFGFDGTLAPIVGEPDHAQMREETRKLLQDVARRCPCAVISGRARVDVAARLACQELVAVVGNYGAEASASPPPVVVRARVRSWAGALRDVTDPEEVQVEDKGFTLALHYRRARAMEHTGRRLWTLAGALPGAKLVGGYGVVNVLPAEGPTKADAIAVLAARFPGRVLAFVDDEVDGSAFVVRGVTLPIRVGRLPASGVGFYLRDQGCIDSLLRQLIRVTPGLVGAHPPVSPEPSRGQDP